MNDQPKNLHQIPSLCSLSLRSNSRYCKAEKERVLDSVYHNCGISGIWVKEYFCAR